MQSLSSREYWDSVRNSPLPAPNTEKRGLLRLLKKRLSQRTLEHMSSYAAYLFWSVLTKRHLPSLTGKTVLEVGSAPGTMLVQFAQTTGCIPFGVEYTESGAESNRQTFVENDLDPNKVIRADFFWETFQDEYRDTFDLVYSVGFIEHFSNPRSVVSQHIDLVAPGGHLIVIIPHLKGVNYALTKFFAPGLVEIHNLDMMTPETFRECFDDPRIKALECRLYGTFNFDLFDDGRPETSWRQRVHTLCQYSQPLLNLAFRRLFSDRAVESRWTSPYLIFIGKKRAENA
jgi:SAM-dependent methyltransferase